MLETHLKHIKVAQISIRSFPELNANRRQCGANGISGYIPREIVPINTNLKVT